MIITNNIKSISKIPSKRKFTISKHYKRKCKLSTIPDTDIIFSRPNRYKIQCKKIVNSTDYPFIYSSLKETPYCPHCIIKRLVGYNNYSRYKIIRSKYNYTVSISEMGNRKKK